MSDAKNSDQKKKKRSFLPIFMKSRTKSSVKNSSKDASTQASETRSLTSEGSSSSAEYHLCSDQVDSSLKICPICLDEKPIPMFPRLRNCQHQSCMDCLRKFINTEISEGRTTLLCPECSEPIHPNDLAELVDDVELLEKYETFMLRRLLATEPDARWCPAPNCTYAVIVGNGRQNRKVRCGISTCGLYFCFNCKQKWHSGPCKPWHTLPAFSDESTDRKNVKLCPSCKTVIMKMDDESCNHMVCSVCGTQFCWLCMRTVTEFHYIGLTGCTFFGKKPWSERKKRLWHLGLLVGSPLAVAVIAALSAPAIVVGMPIFVGYMLYYKFNVPRIKKSKRIAMVSSGVLASILVSPVVAALTVAIGAPLTILYIYAVILSSYFVSGNEDSMFAEDEAEQTCDQSTTSTTRLGL